MKLKIERDREGWLTNKKIISQIEWRVGITLGNWMNFVVN